VFGTRAGLLVDLFLLVLLVCLAAMLVGVALVRRGKVKAHAAVMVATFALFLVALVVFEVSVRFGQPVALAVVPLLVHLPVAVPCLALWAWQVATARGARANPLPHRRRGRALLVLLSLTVATGFWLYVATFA
jgi:uncharacterized membrane protein YozB (DUF420 family)